MAYAPFLSFVILLLSPLSAWALESDRNQSVLVEADEVEIDFTNGKRIYTGNVSVRQGTIRIIADQIELFYDGEQLDHAVATRQNLFTFFWNFHNHVNARNNQPQMPFAVAFNFYNRGPDSLK